MVGAFHHVSTILPPSSFHSILKIIYSFDLYCYTSLHFRYIDFADFSDISV